MFLTYAFGGSTAYSDNPHALFAAHAPLIKDKGLTLMHFDLWVVGGRARLMVHLAALSAKGALSSVRGHLSIPTAKTHAQGLQVLGGVFGGA